VKLPSDAFVDRLYDEMRTISREMSDEEYQDKIRSIQIDLIQGNSLSNKDAWFLIASVMGNVGREE